MGEEWKIIEREEKPLVVFVKSTKTQSTKSGIEFADTLVAASALVTAPSRSPYWTLAFSMSLFPAITNLEFEDQNGKDLKRSFVIHRLNAVKINPTLKPT